MDDDLEVELTDLASDEIRELLLEAGADISVEQAEDLAMLVEAAGGIQEALQALHQLTQQRHAA